MNETTDNTPTRLIEAARKAFGDKGYDAASIREITAAADANLGAVTYHFGSKDALYEAVVEAVFSQVGIHVHQAVQASAEQPALDQLVAVVRALFAAIRANPDFQFLILQAAVLKHRAPAAAVRRFPAILALIAEIVRAGQADGSIRPGDPHLLAISVIAQPAYFGLLVLLLLPRLPADSLPAHGTWEEIADHAVAFVQAGLAAQAEAS